MGADADAQPQQRHGGHAAEHRAGLALEAQRPDEQGQHHQQHEQGGGTVDAALLPQHPQQPDHGGEHGEGHELAEGVHPRAGARQGARHRRPPAGREVRQGHAQAQQGEHRQRLPGRQRDGQAQRGAHEGGGAGRGDGHGQHASQEGIAGGAAGLQAGDAGGQHRAELEQAGQVQSDDGEQRGQRGHHQRALQLEAPADGLARRAQAQQQAAQRHEGQHHARGVGQAGTAVGGFVVRVLGEGQHLDGQHREHAGHEVEDQAADQCTDERRPERDGRAAAPGWRGGAGGVGLQRLLQFGRDGGGQRGGRWPAALHRRLQAHARGAGAFSGRVGQGQHQRHLGGAVAALGRERDAGRPAVAFPGLRPGGAGFDQARRFGEELQFLPLPGGRQTADAGLQEARLGRERAVAGGLVLRRRGPGRVERCAVQRGGALHRDAQAEVALLGNAFLPAGQPGGVELDLDVAAREGRVHGQRHGQQHGAVVTVVGQALQRELARRGPGDLARAHAGGQGPLQFGRQAGVARVFPVGVPVRRVLQLQADPDRRTGAGTFGRVGQQGGCGLLGLDFGAAEQVLGGSGQQVQRAGGQRGQQETGQTVEDGHGQQQVGLRREGRGRSVDGPVNISRH